MSSRSKRRVKRIDTSKMSGAEVEALATWVRDFKKAYPAIQNAADTAKAVWQEMRNADRFRIVESPNPEGVEPQQQPWTVGHAKVNFVDHIKGVEDR